MESRLINGDSYVRFTAAAELESWLVEKGWDNAAHFEYIAGHKISDLVRRQRWVRADKDSYGRPRLSVHLPEPLRITTC